MKLLFVILAFNLSHPTPDGEPLLSTSFGIHPVESCDLAAALPVIANGREQVVAEFPAATITDFGFDCVELTLKPQRGA
jgi:hypothetical protein